MDGCLFVRGEVAVGHEASAVCKRIDGGGILVHQINLLERQALGLWECKHQYRVRYWLRSTAYLRNAEVGEDDAAEACATPDEEDLAFETSSADTFVDKVGR